MDSNRQNIEYIVHRFYVPRAYFESTESNRLDSADVAALHGILVFALKKSARSAC